MLLLGWGRRGWLALLAVTPRPVLARLDAWARAQALRQADRRRQRALQRKALRS